MGTLKGKGCSFPQGTAFISSYVFVQLTLHLCLWLPRDREAQGSFKWAGLRIRSSTGVEFNWCSLCVQEIPGKHRLQSVQAELHIAALR